MMKNVKQHGDRQRNTNLNIKDAPAQRISNQNIAPLAKRIDVVNQNQHLPENWSLNVAKDAWLTTILCG